MKIKLSKALRLKNTLANELKEVSSKVASLNSRNVKSTCEWDVEVLINEMKTKHDKLVAVKAAIAKANVQVYDKIHLLEELKAQISFFQQLDCKSGIFVVNSYDQENQRTDEYKATIGEKECVEIVNGLRVRFEETQDELNAFNFSTTIDIDI